MWRRGVRCLAPLVALGAVLAASPAAATDDEVFRLDPVFVSVFRTEDPADEAIARAIEGRVAARLAERHLVVPVAEVAGFEDYSAEVYLRSCPRDRLSGCAYVIGTRALAEWAVDGFVEPIPDRPGHALVETSITDIQRARTVVTFQIVLDGSNDAAWADAVAGLVDRLSAAGDPEDVRDLAAEEQERLDALRRRAERDAIVASLDALLGDGLKTAVEGSGREVRPVRITADDLERYRRSELTTPWERLGVTPRQYRQLTNRQLTVEALRERVAGRSGRLLVRGSLGGGYGSGRVSYDARQAVDPTTSTVVAEQTTLAVVGGGGVAAELEVGVGVLPWLDLGVGLLSRGGQHDWLVHSESTERPREPSARTTTTGAETELIARVTVVPLPVATVRPLATLGVSRWWGPSVSRFIDFGALPSLDPPARPAAVRVRGGLGAEVEVHPSLALFGRAELVIPVAGTTIERSEQGDVGRLTFKDDRELRTARGGIVAVGLVVRTPPVLRLR